MPKTTPGKLYVNLVLKVRVEFGHLVIKDKDTTTQKKSVSRVSGGVFGIYMKNNFSSKVKHAIIYHTLQF